MHLKPFIIFTLVSLFLLGCSLTPTEMKTAQRIMEANPDSALLILQKLHPNQSLSDADRALYGILLFRALDKSNKPLQPDSVITFSLHYYQNINDKPHLAICYFYKARLYRKAQRYDNATELYLKALDLLQSNKDYKLLGNIYSDMGDICSIQTDYKESLNKYKQAIDCYKKAGDTIQASYKVIDIGRMYCFLKNYNKAQLFYKQALKQTSDSMLQGSAYQEIGINFYKANQFDSAQYYLRKSLHFPFKGTNYAIRYYILADLFFDINEFDSAFNYATKALKYPTTFYNQRDCYRILANAEYSRHNFKNVSYYMSKYQDCTDSVRKIEAQTKISVLEDIHQTNGAFSKSKQFLRLLAMVIPILLLIGLTIVIRLRKRSKKKEIELKQTEVKLTEKQRLLKDSIVQKIEESKLLQTQNQPKISQSQQERIFLDIYSVNLHLNDWAAFKKLMNQTFNNIVDTLESENPDINHKEIIWSCLFLLKISTPDITLILDCQVSSLYKIKQRLAQKMQLKTTKELESRLQILSEVK